MQVVYPVCCGIDVHKTFLVATIIKTNQDGLTPTYSKKRFSTFTRELRALKQWLLENGCKDVCMESTGKYWVPVLNVLEDEINVTIANPKWVSAVKGNKDDVKDSKWIGDLFRMGLVPGSFVPDKDIRVLREFTRYRCKLVAMRASEKNRFQNAFTVCNLTLDAVLSSMFGVSATNILDYLMKTDNIDPAHCASLLRGRAKEKADKIADAVEGFAMTDAQKTRVNIIQSHFTTIDELLARLDCEIAQLIAPFESQIALLCSIPGVDRDTAITIVSEIGTDMKQFSSSKRLCRWAGLTPGNNESAGKKKSVRITRAGVYLKPALVQAAHAAVKCTSQPYYRNKFERISKRRGKKRAIIAIARMILTAVFHMLSNGEYFNPCDLANADVPDSIRKSRLLHSVRSAVDLLVTLGVVSSDNVCLSALVV